MAEWIGGLLSGLPTWLVVVIIIVISVVGAIGILYEPGLPARTRRNHDKK